MLCTPSFRVGTKRASLPNDSVGSSLALCSIWTPLPGGSGCEKHRFYVIGYYLEQEMEEAAAIPVRLTGRTCTEGRRASLFHAAVCVRDSASLACCGEEEWKCGGLRASARDSEES